MVYNTNNVFARILRGELPCQKVCENEFALAFHDVNPVAKIHVLVIPKGPYISFLDFVIKADPLAVQECFSCVRDVVIKMGLEDNGFRLVMNNGPDGGQVVDHFHIHVIGGNPLPVIG